MRKLSTLLIIILKPIITRFPQLAMSYRKARDRWMINEDPQETPMGFKFIGSKMMQNGEFEPEETQIVKDIVSTVDIVVNIGANIGYYCCIALSLDKYVIAFEPIKLNVHYLLKNIRANNWESNIEVYPIALSNKVGVIDIYGGGTGASLLKGWAGTPEQDVTLVPTSKLDNVLNSRLKDSRSFFIVDIEGAEQMLLEGASLILNMKPMPIWLMEISISQHQPKGISLNPNLLSTFQFFWNAGYEAWTANKQCRFISQKEIEELIKSGVDNINTNNFLFFEKGKKTELYNNSLSNILV